MKNKNHEKAPEMAAWVKVMREVFGEDVKVLWVKEGEFEIGEPMGKAAVGRDGGGRKEKAA